MSRLGLVICSLLFSLNSLAAELTVTDQYVRATPPHVKNSAAFLTIENQSEESVKLVSVSSDIADRVELHTHISEAGLMKMRQVESILIKGHNSVQLQPGGYHVMFLGLKNDLIAGDSVDITLYFDTGDAINITAPIQKITMSHTTMTKHQQ
ncbi:copper chaperone PCu(A)C [Psychromonas sp. B3M02]|uniref:copper chaperone PCu(A)C n=1 Tax=Psychromonas sp. B3M02 TaxID=2267226 RepID=UPI000DEABABC|nr:copper chaperone PCu(A)C [Psychromonas sp. B3M02]RBW41564.1 copper chaperone PCu(A)C [Psychromonas sp. B3M02]